MIRQAPRLLLRSSLPLRSAPTHRFLSTAPPAQKSRSLKNYAARLAIGVGVIYYYNTSQLFAEEPPFSIPPPQSPTEETPPQTLESLAIKNRTPPPLTPATATFQPSLNANPNPTIPVSLSPPSSPSTTGPSPNQDLATSHAPESSNPTPPPPSNSDLQSTEEQASQEGAFNEETGEINWDCPCLGGMAHGPCGEQFREAFSCFIYSKDEPKGMDCIPNFKNMQDCFREHPDIYGAELDDDDEAPEDGNECPAPAPVSVEGGEVPAAALSTEGTAAPSTVEGGEVPAAALSTAATPASGSTLHSTPSASSETRGEGIQRGPADEGSVLVPKAAHDATDANVGK